MSDSRPNIARDGIDDTDHAILKVLQLDGRITNTELAATIGLSPSATLRRVRSLEQSGVIDRYVAVCNPAALGQATTVFVEISLSSQSAPSLDEFEAGVNTIPEVQSCHLMAGNADYLLQVACRDVTDYERVHRDHLAQLPGVSRMRSSFALRSVRPAVGLG